LIETLAHFRIVEKLGAGGMGEVYLAEDTRLHRKVALKVLPPELAEHRDRLRRFEQEACAASGLSHPNILVVYEIGEDQGRHYIATEYVDGHTLRRRLMGDGLPPAEALDVAIQVAGALAAAHEAGIVHRDIKPENVMVRPDGYVKLLDFGLAKLGGTDTSSPFDEHADTRTDTEPGKVMGTTEYMSPEQARGLPVDARSDIFSLGSVLYEALSGQPPFRGETRSDVLAALLATEAPPLPRRTATAAAELPWVVSRMLRKDREERYQTAKEVLSDLKRARRALDAAPVARQVPQAPPRRTHFALRAAVVLLGAVLAMAAYGRWTSRPASREVPMPPSRWLMGEEKLGELFRFDAAEGRWVPFLSGLSAHHLDFSPDGRSITYVDYPEGTLWRSRLDGSGRTALTLPPLRAGNPRWSPDGTRIVFVAAVPGKPWKIHMVVPDRSPARPLLDTQDREERTPSWSPDGRKLVYWVPDDKTDKRLIRILDLETWKESAVPGSEAKYSPRWSPDGRMLLAITFDKNALAVMNLGTSRWLEMTGPDVSWPQWSRDGRHIYFQTLSGSNLFRLTVAERKIEGWANTKQIRRVRVEPFGSWLGLTPDDSPVVMGRREDAFRERTAAPPAP
jgi:eukaryotic-like serine/threonine-protein kinase